MKLRKSKLPRQMTVKNCLLIEKLNFKGGKKNVVNPKERLLWSIALPGFGQFLNKKYLKGIVFVFLEFLVNVQILMKSLF